MRSVGGERPASAHFQGKDEVAGAVGVGHAATQGWPSPLQESLPKLRGPPRRRR